jgi:hypothetical protein
MTGVRWHCISVNPRRNADGAPQLTGHLSAFIRGLSVEIAHAAEIRPLPLLYRTRSSVFTVLSCRRNARPLHAQFIEWVHRLWVAGPPTVSLGNWAEELNSVATDGPCLAVCWPNERTNYCVSPAQARPPTRTRAAVTERWVVTVVQTVPAAISSRSCCWYSICIATRRILCQSSMGSTRSRWYERLATCPGGHWAGQWRSARVWTKRTRTKGQRKWVRKRTKATPK